jgi:hypothetical protein
MSGGAASTVFAGIVVAEVSTAAIISLRGLFVVKDAAYRLFSSLHEFVSTGLRSPSSTSSAAIGPHFSARTAASL